ncbi:bifunctional indole-3-glycerol-phosphate synthase TrpC/phosphoribosylanthranilate isomerase TrpF [[Haemophilus] felis]|uniref:Multifunctional fusion protein n=1 Tax=[Haemophilus] felis TaxID=123822 RepID=A0A1T0BAE9_9PAST|nr:bifunctional indole-3-glycerol-phosphate synthase TrpC/phosphoribosylanthranilate isomerase TrpF [[Haemophilus] felis]NBI41542.1 bifunctional indole-3-glycerol-phosphate synthase TrpC/phosphoribosylanthranilate isomerase TrpF [[Haemophilus] felis]OOS07168.1 bifunctional indole-3-glycerol phosphate synthase/phosphoribosylanthranilate isomerase [[Haemophilus] felis]
MNSSITILQKIQQDKEIWIAQQQAAFPLAQFRSQVQPSDRYFYAALQQQKAQKRNAFILECKKASPSKGLIRANFDLDEIAGVYKHYAAAISVLTDEKYFQGQFAYVTQVRQQVSQPVLCKDFILSEYQVYLARYHHADAILLMLSLLNDEQYRQLATLAHRLGMGVLTETSNEQEFERAIALQAKVIGVNNRNLHDLSIDLCRTEQLVRRYAAQLPADTIIISESGIHHHQHIRRLESVADGFLIGSSLMAQADLNNAVRAVIFGENKVCGLTRTEDVQTAYAQGALYGGLIFVPTSPRCVSVEQATALTQAAPLRFVGVFQHQAVSLVAEIATALRLFAVQLHGDEDQNYRQQLRAMLPPDCQIWQAVSVTPEQSQLSLPQNATTDRYLIDTKLNNQQGGTGVAFNWTIIPATFKDKIMLAGGIAPHNIAAALAQQCLGVDINSGAEQQAGIKDPQKLQAIFHHIHRKGNS